LGVEAPEGRVRGGESGGWRSGFWAAPFSTVEGDQLCSSKSREESSRSSLM
jgi:hypothetical protein